MSKPIRTPLNAEQIADARRLKEKYDLAVAQSKANGTGRALNQTEIGLRCGWNSPQSTVSQYVNGKVALNLDALVKLSDALDFEPADVSPTLAGGIARIHEASAPGQSKQPNNAPAANTPFPGGDDVDQGLDERYAFIPQYTARAAAGLGHENPHVECVTTLAFKREWLHAKKGVKPESLIVIYADGDSMWPTINDHDVLLLDTSKTEPADGHVFVLASVDSGAIVKRLVQSPLGGWIIRSDNDDKEEYPDLLLTRSEVNEHRIIGRVIWRGGDL